MTEQATQTLENLRLWNSLNRVPPGMLSVIKGGRLKGKSDINPQWRYQALTEQFGPCGIGWKFEIVRVWEVTAPDGQIEVNVHLNLFYKTDGEWSDPVPGFGGDVLAVLESNGKWYINDEAYKMAVTDALGTAMKMIGTAAKVFMGLWSGSKYADEDETPEEEAKGIEWIEACEAAAEANSDVEVFRKWWDTNQEKITAECGTKIASHVYARFVEIGKLMAATL